jgi:flap endonuclease-1
MGIKYLNKYLQTNCSNSIKQISLNDLRGKKIVIDTSIYLYRFIGENVLLENFYLMISIFREYNIIPLFVFDGKPPKEKNELLQQRKNNKKDAELKYKELEIRLRDTLDASEEDRKEIRDSMESLKKEFVRLRHTDIENVKLLIQSYGVSYVEAPGEAEKLCAKMVCKNKAYACLSEDMDLFVYGCKRVLRYISLLKRTVIMYDLKNMLVELNLTMNEFQSICIVSGTDYNIDNETTLLKTVMYFKKYKHSDKLDFYEWLYDNTTYIKNISELYDIQDMFNLTNMPEYKQYENLKILNGPINKSNLKLIMAKEDFIFAD